MPASLLRVKTTDELSPTHIASRGFGGVVFEINVQTKPHVQFAQQLARDCRQASLEFHIDVSQFPGGKSALTHRHELHFEGTCARIVESTCNLSDPFSKASTQHLCDWMEQLNATLITGVLAEVIWPQDAVTTAPFPAFPWHENFETSFQFDELSALVSGEREDAAVIRQEYWKSVDEALRTGFESPLRQWCNANDIAFCYRSFDPACEALGLTRALRARFHAGRLLWPELISGESCSDLWRDACDLLLAGAQRFQIAHSPQITDAEYRQLNVALSRTAFRPASVNAAQVGVLFPLRSCHTHYHPHGHRLARWVSEDLKAICQTLDELHFDWRFVQEQDAWENFPLVVIPSVTALAQTTWRRVETHTASGGKVACLGLLPRWSERGRDEEFETRIGKTARVVVDDLYAAYEACDNGAALPPTIGFPVFREYSGGGRLCSYQFRLNPDADDARLRIRQILHESITSDLETQNIDLAYLHRYDEAHDEYWLYNQSTHSQRFRLQLHPRRMVTSSQVTLHTPADGMSTPLLVWMAQPSEQGGGIGLAVDLVGHELCQLKIEKGTPTSQIENSSFVVESFDGKTVRGYATESHVPRLAVRHNGHVKWHSGDTISVPQPLLLSDWEMTDEHEYSKRVAVPATWIGHRCCIEIAPLPGVVEVKANETPCGVRFLPPFRYNFSPCLENTSATEEIMFIVKIETALESPPEIYARLTAYPRVAISLNSN